MQIKRRRNFFKRFQLGELSPVGSLFAYSLLLIAVLGISQPSTFAREQWQIQRPDPPPTGWNHNTPPGGINPGASVPSAGMFHPNSQFMQRIAASRIPIGAVLTGMIDTELSSKKSQTGDIFAVVLDHGYQKNGVQIVPPGSKIVGTVTKATPSAAFRNGMPGQLTIGLQTLVFPDGSTCKFTGFIDQNPAFEMGKEPKTQYSGFNLGSYGQQLKGMVGSFAGGIGWVHQARMRGKELKIEQGKVVAVKVNQTINLETMTPPLGQGSVPGMVANNQSNYGFNQANQNPNQGRNLVPGVVQGKVGGSNPYYQRTASHPYSMPGQSNTSRNLNSFNQNPIQRQSSNVPGLVGPDPDRNLAQPNQNRGLPIPQLKAKQLTLQKDPNAIFNQPLDKPVINNMADPF